MAGAGWHYAPVKDSKDNASCAYCELTLDGWEMNDDPLYVVFITLSIIMLTEMV